MMQSAQVDQTRGLIHMAVARDASCHRVIARGIPNEGSRPDEAVPRQRAARRPEVDAGQHVCRAGYGTSLRAGLA